MGKSILNWKKYTKNKYESFTAWSKSVKVLFYSQEVRLYLSLKCCQTLAQCLLIPTRWGHNCYTFFSLIFVLCVFHSTGPLAMSACVFVCLCGLSPRTALQVGLETSSLMVMMMMINITMTTTTKITTMSKMKTTIVFFFFLHYFIS